MPPTKDDELRQADLFFGPDVRRDRGMGAMDRIKAKYGRVTVGVGITGWRVGGARPGEQRHGGKERNGGRR